MTGNVGPRPAAREPAVGPRGVGRPVALAPHDLASYDPASSAITHDLAAPAAILSAPRSVLAVWDIPSPSRLSTPQWCWVRRAVTGLVFSGLTTTGVLVGLGGASVSPVAPAADPTVEPAADPVRPGARTGATRPGTRSDAARPDTARPDTRSDPRRPDAAVRPAPAAPRVAPRVAPTRRPDPGRRSTPTRPPAPGRAAPGAP